MLGAACGIRRLRRAWGRPCAVGADRSFRMIVTGTFTMRSFGLVDDRRQGKPVSLENRVCGYVDEDGTYRRRIEYVAVVVPQSVAASLPPRTSTDKHPGHPVTIMCSGLCVGTSMKIISATGWRLESRARSWRFVTRKDRERGFATWRPGEASCRSCCSGTTATSGPTSAVWPSRTGPSSERASRHHTRC